MKLKYVLLLVSTICLHSQLVLSLKYRRRAGNVVKGIGRGTFPHQLFKKKTVSFKEDEKLILSRNLPTSLNLDHSLRNIHMQLKTAVRQTLSTAAIPTSGFTAVKEAIHQKPSSRNYLTRNGSQSLPPKKAIILGVSTVVHPTAKAKKTAKASRLKITKQGQNSIRSKSREPSSRSSITSSESQNLPPMKGRIWSISEAVQPTTKAKKTRITKLLKITEHKGKYEIRTKLPKPSSRHSVSDIGHQSLAPMLGSTWSTTSKEVEPIASAKKTMITKKVKIHKDGNGEKGGETNDIKKNKTSDKRHWIKRPTLTEHPHSGYFGVIFILVIVLTLAMYGLYHNRQKIMVLVTEGRHPENRPNSSQYRKLEDAMPSFKRI